MIRMQKVIKVGNSLAVTLDNRFVQQKAVKAGTSLAVSYKPEKGLISMALSKDDLQSKYMVNEEAITYMAGKITPELEQWTKKFLVENQEAMKQLADL